MAVDITEGEVSAIRFLRAVEAAPKAPPAVKQHFRELVAAVNWAALEQDAKPLLAPMKLPSFTAAEAAEIGPLTDPQRDIYLFYHALSAPDAAPVKDRVDGLRSWGAWESLAKLVSSNPNIPFHFSAKDLKRVFDPSGTLPELTVAQAEAKTFLATIGTDPKATDLKTEVDRFLRWGGYESVAKFVSDHPAIPFHFTADDVRAVADPGGAIPPRSPAQIDVLSFVDGLATASAGNDDVRKFYDDIQARIQHGCWKSIADIVNGNDKIPFKGFDPVTIQATLDPDRKYGSDDACSALAPPEPPAWTKPIVWSIGAGLAAYNWTLGAAGSVADWTTGAANDVADWTVGAADSVADWTTGAAGDVASWTSGAIGSIGGWASSLGGSVASWTTGAASEVSSWTKGAASSAASWTSGAASTVAHTFNPSNW